MRLSLRLLTMTGWTIIAANAAAALADQQTPTLEQMLAQAKVTMTQAMDAATKAVRGGKAYSAELVMDGDRLEYQVLLLAGGRHVLAEVDAKNGKVTVQKMADEEDQSDEDVLDRVPPAVQATILKEADGGEIEEIETLYKACVAKDGEEFDILVDEDGALIGESDSDDDDDEIDQDEVLMVRATVVTQSPGHSAAVRSCREDDKQHLCCAAIGNNLLQTYSDPDADGSLARAD